MTPTGELPETADEAADPADDLDRAHQRRALLIALGELPERERTVVSLRYGGELNASEIAAAIGKHGGEADFASLMADDMIGRLEHDFETLSTQLEQLDRELVR